MTLCFASLARILCLCSKANIPQKILCGRLLASINWEYGTSLEASDVNVSRILSCSTGLSPKVTKVISDKEIEDIAEFVNAEIIRLLDENKHGVILSALKELLNSCIKTETIVGSRSNNTIISAGNDNLVLTIADILYYTVAYIDNKKGKDDIEQINENFIYKVEERLQQSFQLIVDNTELNKTITDSNFSEVFHKFDCETALELENQSGIELYYLDITGSEFDYYQLIEYLLDCVGMCVYSRVQIKAFEDAKRIRNIGLKAVRNMNENGDPDEKGTGNELGEIMTYAFIEDVLNAPKLLSKVEIKGTKSKSDSIHLLKRNVNGTIQYQLVCGTSSIHDNIIQAVDEAFSLIEKIKKGQMNERKTAQNTLYDNIYDDETTKVLASILIPSKEKNRTPDIAFGVFIGYSLNVYDNNNDGFFEKAMDKMKQDIELVIPYIKYKAKKLNLLMHSYYFYFFPMNHAEEDKKDIMKELLLGGA